MIVKEKTQKISFEKKKTTAVKTLITTYVPKISKSSKCECTCEVTRQISSMYLDRKHVRFKTTKFR